jgi:integrase
LVAAGIPPLLVERADRKVRFHRHTLYALRHTFSTWYRAAGANKEERKQAMGQTTDEAHEYYQHDQDPAILEAQRKLINLLPCVPVTWTTEAGKSL